MSQLEKEIRTVLQERELEKLRATIVEAAVLLASIMRDEVNAQDEAEKWLREYAPQHLFLIKK
jgi:hypothetical protein